jgi:hypothetical protein
MDNHSKSLLPLIEILISTGIFAIAVVLTLQIFMLSKFLGYQTSDTADAILKVQHIAETIKSFQSSSEIDDFLENDTVKGKEAEDFYHVYYDVNWNQTDNFEEAVYITDIYIEDKSAGEAGTMYKYSISLYKIEAYPFINDRHTEANPNYRPLLASVNSGKFTVNN